MVASNPFQNLTVTFAPGERIFSEGEVGATMFIVQAGRARLFHQVEGKLVAIAEMEKGDFFGEMSLLEGTARTHSAEAIDPLELIEINSTTFDRMIRGNIEIAVRMIRKLSGRLQKAEGQIAARRAAPVPVVAFAVAAGHEPEAAVAAAGRHSPAISVGEITRAGAPPVPVASVAASAAATNATATAPHRPAGFAPGHRPAPPIAVPAPPARSVGASASALRAATLRDSAAAGPRLVSESGEAVFPIRTPEATVGRYDPVTETQPEVDLTLVDVKRSVSRRHAKITSKGGLVFLTKEVGALNGTFINGSKLVTGKPAPLKNGDQISLGTVHLVFRS